MIEDQVHQHPVRLPPDKHAHVDATGVKFENDQSREPLLTEKQSSHRITPTDARLRTSSESSHGKTVMGTTSAADASMIMVTDTNACIDNSVGVNNAIVTTVSVDDANRSLDEDYMEVPIFEEGTDSGRLPDVVAESKIYGVTEDEPIESYLAITIQVFIPFLIAGLGMVGAGLVLDLVQHWVVFEKVSELIILVPALLGLKGNLEMTLASRLSTQANLGHMDTPKQQWYMIVGNLVLIQCQAIVVGFLGSLVAIIMGAVRNGTISLDHSYLLCASSLVTASLASFVLGLITAGVIVFSRHCHINPDNVATPIAASLGDITSLALLSWISTILYESINKQDWVAPLVIACYVLVTPLWVWIAKRNKYTNDVLYFGWTPVMIAMLISSCGGLILEFMVSRFENLTVFQPVINGVGGNLVAVQASRISTALHKQAELGTLLIPPGHTHPVIFITPIANFFGKGIHARTTRVLMAMVIPGHIIFIYMINYMKDGETSLTPLFVFVYLCAAMLQVAALLYIAYIMIHWMWKRKIDPDNSAIPYLTSMGDLLGISLLAIAFQFLYLVGDQDSERTIAP
ncbi:solute carrier family 41 member 1-like isoform X1 [Hylaeus anthracinus]|uniref:solute carrier family 41 member 1-like isoform X1 n=2 Tax=Hylaeus volcanicus TaxID=313075 RepID=UPI0023B817E7|nr:solute carrier family 41 member 1-like isoform X1 [Hylaeus volcanicus]XP_053974238.1 solute carrier family 41 member 1-like isoform X1 [Hylaeus volcanicus]XP_053974239.1 solute carrier family 41 member 1-like isoform X1 [Hylaeus volcanicus]XP_053974240.1 solute carrier family 41 member 1-like isoform X1 [Hylaeus volcanicus]XP_053974241.1 solute carrier family 41 member 1-like isoform X1 [Hylaeus volcanicus]XP_054000157.1 solute carrier family 41 member 1-like isoform X1 [Hylaeus anthracinus